MLVQLFLAACLAPAAFAAASQKAFVLFGDSVTDNGNYFKANGHAAPLSAYYWNGRLTNAPGTWADQVTGINKHLSVYNFAYAGSTACKVTDYMPGFKAPAPLSKTLSLSEQVAAYTAKLKADKKFKAGLAGKTVIPVVWIGHQDLQFLVQLSPDQAKALPAKVVGCILANTRALLDAGHSTVVVGTLAPTDLTPFVVRAKMQPVIKAVLTGINTGLKAGVAQLAAAYKKQKKTVVLWDSSPDLASVAANPKKFGFKFGTPNTCLTVSLGYSAVLGNKPQSSCKDPNQYLYYDDIHPTAKSHQLIAQFFLDSMVKSKILASRTA